MKSVVLYTFLLLCPAALAQSPGIAWEHISLEMYGAAGHQLCTRSPSELYVASDNYASVEKKLERFNRLSGERIWSISVDTIPTNFGIESVGNDGVIVGGANSVEYGVARIDTAGQLIWNYKESLDEGDNWELGGISCDANQNTYIAWYRGHFDVFDIHHTFISKFSPNGTHEWDYEFATAWPMSNWPDHIDIDQDGNVLVGGWRETNDGTNPIDAYLLKLDPSGNHLWDVMYHTEDDSEEVLDMAIVEDNAILLCIGRPDDFDAGSVVKYTSTGALEWGYDAPDSHHPFKIIVPPGATSYYVLERISSGNPNRLLKFSFDGDLLLDVANSGSLVRNAIPIDQGLILLSRVLPGLYEDAHFTAIDTLGNVVWDLPYPGACGICEAYNTWPMVAGDSGVVYTTGSHVDVNLNQRVATLAISIPCIPAESYCLDSAYSDTLALSTSACVADLNGDGLADIMTTQYNQQELLLYFNTGGNFELSQTITLPYMGGFIRTADINSDGALDILISEEQGDRVMMIVNNNNVFGYQGSIQTASEIYQIELGNADGVNGPDLFVRYDGSIQDQIHIYPNSGSGAFDAAPYVLFVPGFVGSMDVGDLDLDGLADVALMGWGGAYGKVYFAQGNGAYGGALDIAFNGAFVRIVDANDDGWPDVLTVGNGEVSVNWNQSGASFQYAQWNVPGFASHGIPHPFPDNAATRFFLPNLSETVSGLNTWDDCTTDFSFFGLGSTQLATLFAEDITGDAGVDLLALEPLSGILHVWRNCDHTPVFASIDAPSVDQRGAVRIYPNPAGDQVMIQGTERGSDLCIVDPLGRIVYHKQAKGTSTLVSLVGWAPGLYCINTSGGSAKSTTKLLVSK